MTDRSTHYKDKDIYEDTGCHVHPKCLECPLPECILDDPMIVRKIERQQRDAQVMSLLGQGYGTAEVAEMMGLTERTVFRAKARSV
jgi:hypothetical protein